MRRDKRNAEKQLRMDRKGESSKTGAKVSQADDINDLKAQMGSLMSAVASANTVTSEPEEENPQAMFAALRATLKKIAADRVRGPETLDLYSTSPRNIADIGACIPFVKNSSSLTKKVKHIRKLINSDGKPS